MAVRRGDTSSPKATKMRRALALAIEGASNTQISEALGVVPETVRLWRADPDFDAELREAQAAVFDAVHATLVARATGVAAGLADLAVGIDDVDLDARPNAVRVPAMARTNACKAFFELLGRHKNAPVQPVERAVSLETEEDELRILAEIPAEILRKALKAKERSL